MSGEPGNKQRLQALAAFLPIFEEPGFSAGEMVFPPDLPNGVGRFPYSVRSEPVTRFVEVLYEENWIVPFDWSKWFETQEARDLFENDGAALAKASEEQLSKMLTFCERRCRFGWGDPLLDDFESGLIQRIVRRAHELQGYDFG